MVGGCGRETERDRERMKGESQIFAQSFLFGVSQSSGSKVEEYIKREIFRGLFIYF